MVLKLTYSIFYTDNINLGLVPFSICNKMFMIHSMGVGQTSRFMFYLLSGHNYVHNFIFSYVCVCVHIYYVYLLYQLII